MQKKKQAESISKTLINNSWGKEENITEIKILEMDREQRLQI